MNFLEALFNNAKIELSDENRKLVKADGIKFVFSYTGRVDGKPPDKDGKSVPSADQWIKSYSYNQATNTFA